MPSIEEWGNKSELECKLTDNNQSVYAAERSAYADQGMETDDNLTTNKQQPIRRFSDGDTPASSHTPKTTTTGCTTLPSDPDTISPEIDPNQQSGMNTGDFVTDAGRRAFAELAQPIEKDPPKKTMADWGHEKQEFKENLANSKKDPPAPPRTFHISEFMLPGEKGGAQPDINYDGPKLHIVHDQEACYVEIRDDEGKSIDFTWQREREPFVGQTFILQVPDWRHLLAEIAKHQSYQDEILVLTRRNVAQLAIVKEQLDKWTKDFAVDISALLAEKVKLTAQNDQLKADNKRLDYRHQLDMQSITGLRTANLTITENYRERGEEIKRLARERHELAEAVKIVNPHNLPFIERIKEILKEYSR